MVLQTCAVPSVNGSHTIRCESKFVGLLCEHKGSWFAVCPVFALSWVQTSMHSSNVAQTRQRQMWSQWIFVHADSQETRIERECGSRFGLPNEPFSVSFFGITKRFAVNVWMGIGHCLVCLPGVRCGGRNFFVNCSVFNCTQKQFQNYTNVIMVRCVFLRHSQLFATTNLPHSMFVAATFAPCSSCARSSGPSLRFTEN